MKIKLTGEAFNCEDDTAFAVWPAGEASDATLTIDITDDIIKEITDQVYPVIEALRERGRVEIRLTRRIHYTWGDNLEGTYIDHGKERDAFDDEETSAEYITGLIVDLHTVEFSIAPEDMMYFQAWNITFDLMENETFSKAYNNLNA